MRKGPPFPEGLWYCGVTESLSAQAGRTPIGYAAILPMVRLFDCDGEHKSTERESEHEGLESGHYRRSFLLRQRSHVTLRNATATIAMGSQMIEAQGMWLVIEKILPSTQESCSCSLR